MDKTTNLIVIYPVARARHNHDVNHGVESGYIYRKNI